VGLSEAVATSGRTKWSSQRFSEVLHRRHGNQALDTSSAPHRPPQRHGFARKLHAEVNNRGQGPARLTDGPRDQLRNARWQFPQIARRSTSV